jgi:hypothetical protein
VPIHEGTVTESHHGGVHRLLCKPDTVKEGMEQQAPPVGWFISDQ